MTQNPRIVSAHAGQRLGHLARQHSQSITQMTQLCKIRILAIYLLACLANCKEIAYTLGSLRRKGKIYSKRKAQNDKI